MRRAWAAVILILLVGFFGGCALPRALKMDAMIKDVPVPPDSKRVETSVGPFVTEPGASATVESSKSPDELVLWYRQALESHGWKSESHDNTKNSSGQHIEEFHRRIDWVWAIGSLRPEEQTVGVVVEPAKSGSGSTVDIYIYCSSDYVWDMLTKVVYVPFYYAGGESATFAPLFIFF